MGMISYPDLDDLPNSATGLLHSDSTLCSENLEPSILTGHLDRPSWPAILTGHPDCHKL